MRKYYTWAPGLILATVALFVIFGSMRYGGFEGLYRRVYAEFAARLPHPEFVPTPLPTASSYAIGRSALPSATQIAATDSSFSGQTSTPGHAAPEAETAGTNTSSRSTPPIATEVATAGSAFFEQTHASGRAQQGKKTARSNDLSRSTPPSVTKVAATKRPTPTPSAGPSPASPAASPLPASVRLAGLTHMWQTWNNCGPATLAMNLSYYGRTVSQAAVASALRPNKEDKNVSPDELATFARAQGLRALVRVDGDRDHLRRLLSTGVPVLIETWYEPKPNDGMGHYRLLTGYDDASGEWIAYDSFDARGVDPKKPYAGIHLSYEQVDRLWAVFNRQYIVIYTDQLAPAVQIILGDDMDEATMWERALKNAQAAVSERPKDPFGWFNLGTDLAALARYEQAADAYDRARQIGLPWRMLWYQFGPFQAYFEVGRDDEVIALANATLRTAKYVEELYYWRGLAQQAQGKFTEARASFQQALGLNRNFALAAAALATLPAP